MTSHEIVDILIEADVQDIDLDRFVRDAGVSVSFDDFKLDHSQDRFAGYSNGNSNIGVYYKRRTIGGKPVYLGNVLACHDYNRTGSTAHVSFWAQPPSRSWEYNPLVRGKPLYRTAKQRKNYGYGVVHMDAPKPGEGHFDNLFDACKYLLRLLRMGNKRLKVAEAVAALLSQ